MSKDYEGEGRFTFTSHEPGEHIICLHTNTSRWFGGRTLVCGPFVLSLSLSLSLFPCSFLTLLLTSALAGAPGHPHWRGVDRLRKGAEKGAVHRRADTALPAAGPSQANCQRAGLPAGNGKKKKDDRKGRTVLLWRFSLPCYFGLTFFSSFFFFFLSCVSNERRRFASWVRARTCACCGGPLRRQWCWCSRATGSCATSSRSLRPRSWCNVVCRGVHVISMLPYTYRPSAN